MKVGPSDKMKVSYFINLDNRQDRRHEFNANTSGLSFAIERHKAVDSKELNPADYLVPTPIAACWQSHQNVAEIFLSSKATHCLVFEDDVRIELKHVDEINRIWNSSLDGIDLLQIGYCVHNNSLSNRFSYSWQQIIVRLFVMLRLLNHNRVQAYLSKKYGYSFEYLTSIDMVAAAQTFELGTHAYIISRKFADFLIQFNNPIYLPADLALMEMSKVQNFKCYRLLDNLLLQSDSPSSISNASNSPLERFFENLGA